MSDLDRRDTDPAPAPALLDADLPEEDTARHSAAELRAQARDRAIALASAQEAVCILAPRLGKILEAQERLEEKLDRYQASVNTLAQQLREYRQECGARHGNGHCADREYPSGRG